ncbi:lysophospholipid acyltransferase family protein [Campylobacter sp. FMV-PI01]|uniref:Lysophospholipid acyltransferase family protein n=1 Tax=Campylobacter portucalensis TaxID=2608384 RepID=A0A6L5WF83_9BACT|nr:lysophospholipid acyltransferase family protein [Campylobacter portucalensis]MSN95640.1 lysophospholipid acyltransferase family protein [Campylobacter portucalensis]
MEKSSLKNRILMFLTKWILFCAVWLIYLTCKKTFTKTQLPPNPCVVVFWHGRLAMMSFAYRHWWLKKFKGKKQGKVIISDHKDGEIIAQVIEKFHIKAIRGSSSKGAIKALINSFKEIKNGIDVIITPDGPRGPIYSVADGAVIIAQKMELEIYALNYEASKFWKFKSWDEMILPKPFSTINFSLSKSFSVKNLSINEAKAKIQSQLFMAKANDMKFSL